MTTIYEHKNNAESIENTTTSEHLTISERYILTFIKFKTNNDYDFYASNDYIARQIGCLVSSTKTMVNKLIRLGYLEKGADEYGRRTLKLTEKPYVPLDGVDMSNKSKSLMKQDIQNFERMEKQYRRDIAELKRDRDSLEHLCAMLRDAFLSKGYTLNDVEKMVADEERKKLKNGFSENQNYKISMPEQSKTIDKPIIQEIQPITNTDISFNAQNHSSVTMISDAPKDDPQSVINEILAKFKVPTVC